ncbi:mRNA 3'-end-processing protein rna14, partial [Rhizopus stolonifer]
DIDGELREQLRSKERHAKREQEAVEKKLNEQVEVIARAGSLVWINYMRFARRTDGIKSARALFSKARKATNCTYHVYVADALMEYHNSKDATIAGKVFSLGQKSFADHPDFVCQYLDFLIQMNDDNNTRALFERTLATMPAEKAGPIWLKFLDYENKYGDLASVQSVEKRRIEAMANPNVSIMESFLKRQSYLDICTIEEQELGYAARRRLQQEQTETKETVQEQPTPAPPAAPPVQTSKEHQKRPLLEPVHPEKYPRPDLSQWQPFKPAARPANASPLITTIVPGPPVDTPPQPPSPPAPTVPIQPQWTTSLPDAVAYFVSNLPPAQTFNGPIIPPGEIVELLRTIIIPLPPQRPSVKPPPREMPRNFGRPAPPPSNPARPQGFKGGRPPNQMPMRATGAGKPNAKRIGPNRPPDFDLFRQRQAKRHRDDPPF